MRLNLAADENSAPPQSKRVDFPHRHHDWYQAYMAALFEADRTVAAQRIDHAERLILQRERELFRDASDFAERRLLNNALHALKALHTCFKL